MNLEEALRRYQRAAEVRPEEAELRRAVQRAQNALYRAEERRRLSYREFLWTQLRAIQKRWWLLQFLLLCGLGAALPYAHYRACFFQRGLGVAASLFVILLIPELWKNRSCQCMEVEGAAYYSLRQVYAARMVLFGGVDLLLLTAFCGAATAGFGFDPVNLMIQFLLPVLVTACVCFGTLCSKYSFHETTAVALCLLWSALWSVVVLNEKVYAAISLPVWMGSVAAALMILCVTVCRAVRNCNQIWEVALHGIGVE